MAGTSLYDAMYHQHFLGSLKLIPLPAVGEYVRTSVQRGTYIHTCHQASNQLYGDLIEMAKNIKAMEIKRVGYPIILLTNRQ